MEYKKLFGKKILITEIFRKQTIRTPELHMGKRINRIWCPVRWAFYQEAIIIGVRTLQEGWNEWEEEIGYVFTPRRYKKALLVVENMHKKPILIPMPDDNLLNSLLCK